MGLFDFLKTPQNENKQFVTEQDFSENSVNQIQMAPKTMEHLRNIGMKEDTELKLEYFFYTNNVDKAKIFAIELAKLNYTVDCEQSSGDKNLFLITGWTTKMKMTNDVVEIWTKQMCELGYKFDCDFDGWGTTPNQKD